MPLLKITLQFGTKVNHAVVMTDDPRPAQTLGKELSSITIPADVARLPLRRLARLFPATTEGEITLGPSDEQVRQGLAKAERAARRQQARA